MYLAAGKDRQERKYLRTNKKKVAQNLQMICQKQKVVRKKIHATKSYV